MQEDQGNLRLADMNQLEIVKGLKYVVKDLNLMFEHLIETFGEI